MSSAAPQEVYDLIGLGFGPANIAIAAALTETWNTSSESSNPVKKTLFIERHDKFRWHPGMLLPDARMQISFMKDLATLRNPQSQYTFLSYLYSQDRLINFINRGSTIPTRKEYADYLAWAAQRVQDNGVNVLFGHVVTDLREGQNGTIGVHFTSVATGEHRVVLTRDLIISPGGSPLIPKVLSPLVKHPKVLHSSAYCITIGPILDSLAKQARALRIAVVGSGQSAAEVTLDLRQRLGVIPTTGSCHEVDMIIRKGSLKPSDDSPFANEIFDPASTDAWYSMPSKRVRETTLREYKTTNYGVVNPRTLEVLYEVIYDQKLNDGIESRTGTKAAAAEALINIRPYSSIASIDVTSSDKKSTSCDLLLSTEDANPANAIAQESFLISSQHIINRASSERTYDAIVYATGYQRSYWIDLLKNSGIGKYFGLQPSSSSVILSPTSEQPPSTPCFSESRSEIPSSETSSSTSSTISTPLTSPEPSMFGSTHLEPCAPQEVYISRNYRLLPTPIEDEQGNRTTLLPRIYLQGVEEATHGLSDTLLSVLGVRAGEVLEDICNRQMD
ncbi:L-lysine 6-monooxygenase (NADPH-requiring)-domain-containing protein [Crucibulum laeve]|uniref:L-ornithine N(5)-monooxygenase [NAD(P)H] n=1 Tax=Crucibulum laeve TaxID=68775 RepID=A0A5C3MMZ1_9AGAR|nr:L-lysine 6-monooxygenase (NADPH-requiring)-domain-containing protein [Crucibulum laeve]